MPATTSPPPVAGPRFKRAVSPTTEGRGDAATRKVLASLAAFADAGESSLPFRELTRRLKLSPRAIDRRLENLSPQRLIWASWAPTKRYGADAAPQLNHMRNRYALLLCGDPLPDGASAVLAAAKARREVMA